MSEIKQFIQKFLDVSEIHYPDMLVNVKMMEDIVEGYVAHVEKKKAEINSERVIPASKDDYALINLLATNYTQEEYARHDLTGMDDGFDAAIRKSKEKINNPVRTLVWDSDNNCYLPEKKKATIGDIDGITENLH